MNELMKLADAFAEYKDHSEYVHSRAALQSAIEALQAENEHLRESGVYAMQAYGELQAENERLKYEIWNQKEMSKEYTNEG